MASTDDIKHTTLSDTPGRLTNDTMVTAKDGRQHSWRDVKLLIATLLVTSLGDGFCSVMMSVALPDIADAYHTSISVANWTTVGYAIVACTAVMTAASALARWGLRKVFTFGRIMLVASSILGLCSLNFPMMLGSRLLMAVSAGLMYPTVNTVLVRVVPKRISGTVVSMSSAIIGVGIAIAPLCTGLFLTYVSLTSMFWVPLVIGVVSLLMGLRFVFDVEARKKQNIDVLSLVLAFVGLTALMMGFSELTHRTAMACGMLVAGVAVLAWFAVRQLHLTQPLLDIRPLIEHAFVSCGVVLYLAGSMGQQVVLLLMPLYLEKACGVTPFVAGALMLIVALFYAGFDLMGGRNVDRYGMWPLVSIGFLLLTLGLFGLVFAAPSRIVWLMIAIGCVAVVGDATMTVPDRDVVFEAVPDAEMPSVSSEFSTGAQLAGSLASALFVGVLSADVLRDEAGGLGHVAAYTHGFSHSVLIAAVIEVVMLVVSVWYSREMVRHGMAKINK